MPNVKTSNNVIWTLPFFSEIQESEMEELLRVSSFKHSKRGDSIFLHGDPLTHLYWVCDGAVQMFRSTIDGHELTTSINIFGDLLFDPDALQNKKIHTTNARAIKDSLLLSIPYIWMEDSIKTYDHLANKFINVLSKHTQKALIEVEHQATMSATQLVVCFLQELCVSHKLNPKGFELPYTKSLIASKLGMELETLSRTLPKLKEFGITVDGKYVSFINTYTNNTCTCTTCSATEDCSIYKMMKQSLEVN